MNDLTDGELLRYARQIMLPSIDYAGQQRLRAAHALVIGLGGLGSPVALYLAAAGVGRLTLVDDDRVDLSNLQRQIAHATPDIGSAKALSAAHRCTSINPHTTVETLTHRLSPQELRSRIASVDAVLDCCDNFATRFAINEACLAARRPLISGAAIRWEGQVAVFDARMAGSACYRCLYPDIDDVAETCTQSGVIAPLTGVIGSLQATETLKLLAATGTTLAGRLLRYDALRGQLRVSQLPRDPDCPSCNALT